MGILIRLLLSRSSAPRSFVWHRNMLTRLRASCLFVKKPHAYEATSRDQGRAATVDSRVTYLRLVRRH